VAPAARVKALRLIKRFRFRLGVRTRWHARKNRLVATGGAAENASTAGWRRYVGIPGGTESRFPWPILQTVS